MLSLSFLVALPIGIAASIMIVRDLNLFMPCIVTGAGNAGTVAITQGCQFRTALSQTFPELLLKLALVPGGMLLGASLGVVGTLTIRPRALIISSLILLLESIPLTFVGLYLLALLPAGFYFWEGRTKALF